MNGLAGEEDAVPGNRISVFSIEQVSVDDREGGLLVFVLGGFVLGMPRRRANQQDGETSRPPSRSLDLEQFHRVELNHVWDAAASLHLRGTHTFP